MRLLNIVDIVRDAGVIGAGGAGFPTHVKLNSRPELIIVNGAECEPLLRVDRELGAKFAPRLAAALERLRAELGAERAIYALKEHYREAAEAMREAAASYPKLSVSLLPNIYPAGDEQVLVHETTGRIVPEGAIPLSVGAVVINVETLFNIYGALFEGKAVTEKFVTVTGAVERPATLRAPIGVPLASLLELCGAPSGGGFAVVEGGPMMGRLAADLSAPVTKTTKGLIVLPEDHPVLASKRRSLESMLRIARSACCHCMHCTELCPRALLGHALRPDRLMRIASYGGLCEGGADITEALLCCECGLCEIACVMNLQPWKLNHELKVRLAANRVKNPHSTAPSEPHPFREYRRYPAHKLLTMLGLLEYDAEAKLDETLCLSPKSVTLPLKQSAGAPSKPLAARGERVAAGDVIAEIPQGALGSRLHASIGGVVSSVARGAVTIKETE